MFENTISLSMVLTTLVFLLLVSCGGAEQQPVSLPAADDSSAESLDVFEPLFVDSPVSRESWKTACSQYSRQLSSLTESVAQYDQETAGRLLGLVEDSFSTLQTAGPVMVVQLVAVKEQTWRRAFAEEIAGRRYNEKEYQQRVHRAQMILDTPAGFAVPPREAIAEAIPPGVGPALGSLLGWMAVAVVEDTPISLPDERALIEKTSMAVDLGEDPDQGLIELSVGLSSELLDLQLMALETMRPLVEKVGTAGGGASESEFDLAKMAEVNAAHSRELFELSESIWNTADEPFQTARAIQERGQSFLARVSTK